MSVHKRKQRFYFHPDWKLFKEFIKGKIDSEKEKRFVRHLVTCRSCLERRLPEALSIRCYKISHHKERITKAAQILGEEHLTDRQITGFVNNTLSPEERAEVAIHMGICNRCFGDLVEVWQEEILSKEEKLVFEITKKRVLGTL